MSRICNILVLEAHEGVRALLRDALDREGYRLGFAANGEELRAALARRRFDIVVIDVSLRGEDGFALASEAAAAGCGIVLTTADQRFFEPVEKSGHHFVHKPFMIASLLAAIEDVLREVEARCVKRQQRSGPNQVANS